MNSLFQKPLTVAGACFAVGAALILLSGANPEFRWAAVWIFAAVALGAGMAVRRGLRLRADEAARLVARVAGFHENAAGEPLAPVLQIAPKADGSGPLFDPILAAARGASQHVARERAQMEESRHQLEALLENMQDAVLGVDAAGRVQWSNDRMAQLMQRDPAGASVRLGRALVHTFRDPVLLATVQATLDHRVVSDCRSEALLPGSVFQVSASPLPGAGAVVVLRDITRAEAVERTQRDFVANVSHELRTPLTSIVGYVETVLDNEDLTPPAKEFLNTVLKNASRMHRLTEDLLLLTRVEQNENPLDPAPIAADTLVYEALRTVSVTAYAEGALLEVGDVTEREVMADENAILQVLGNLLENAVKYSSGRSQPPHVIVSAQTFRDEPSFVVFQVKDFGPGIPSEHLPRIFERFYRVEKARSRATGGTGLGLSIARHLVEQLGGCIWAESVLGQGSTFFFTLPAAD